MYDEFKTRQDVKDALDAQWDTQSVSDGQRTDYTGMENMLSEILTASFLTDADKLAAARECLDAFTGRRHFPMSTYLKFASEEIQKKA